VTDFSGVEAKLGRAKYHLNEFERVAAAWIASSPFDLVPTMAADGLREELHVKLASDVPPDLDLILGDCIHNVRSALDHLAMALAIANGASSYDGSVMFPIYRDPVKFKKEGRQRIKLLAPLAQDFVRDLQPFEDQENGWILWELNSLDNRDKHRALLTHEMQPFYTFGAPGPVRFEYPKRFQIQNGALYATVIYPQGYDGPSVKPQVQAGLTVEHSNPGGFIEVQRFLRRELLPYVETAIVSEAKSLFP